MFVDLAEIAVDEAHDRAVFPQLMETRPNSMYSLAARR
jgi:hypothetical protein